MTLREGTIWLDTGLMLGVLCVSNRLRELTLHGVHGETLEVKADDVLAVESAETRASSPVRTRILLSRTNQDGRNEEILVRETAEVVAGKLRDAQGAGNWQGA